MKAEIKGTQCKNKARKCRSVRTLHFFQNGLVMNGASAEVVLFGY
jgi:hypothetical protein